MAINNHKHSGLGGDGEKINYNDLTNKPDAVEPKFFTGTRTYSTTSGLGSFSVTGVGFNPKLVQISSIRLPNATDPIFSICDITEPTEGNFSYSELYKDNVNKSYVYNSLAFRVTDAGGDPGTTATMLSFDNDGFTLNITKASWNVEMKITCFG